MVMVEQYFVPVWTKYKPAILKMMIESATEPQSYQLSNHEFKMLNPRQKGGFAFTLKVSDGKLLNGFKSPGIAHDLWGILQLSRKATELISNATYEFSMDKRFVLHVNKINTI